jgi:hypothetical protein
MKLDDVLELVRDAREAIEVGRAEDAVWLLETVEDDLVANSIGRAVISELVCGELMLASAPSVTVQQSDRNGDRTLSGGKVGAMDS